jgi:hypothetical protein
MNKQKTKYIAVVTFKVGSVKQFIFSDLSEGFTASVGPAFDRAVDAYRAALETTNPKYVERIEVQAV